MTNKQVDLLFVDETINRLWVIKKDEGCAGLGEKHCSSCAFGHLAPNGWECALTTIINDLRFYRTNFTQDKK
jgi:hypothetical protein